MDVPILNVLSAKRCTLKGMEQLQFKDFFTIYTAEHHQLDEQFSIGAKTFNHEDLIFIEVEVDARKSVNRREFEQGSCAMTIHFYHCVLLRKKKECIIVPYGIFCEKN